MAHRLAAIADTNQLVEINIGQHNMPLASAGVQGAFDQDISGEDLAGLVVRTSSSAMSG